MAIQNTLLQSENEGLLNALAVKRKREAAQKAALRKKQKRSARDDIGGASHIARTPTPPHQTNTRGRKILQPRKYW
jgi:hypothetical protein